jgi:hypothetical protein
MIRIIATLAAIATLALGACTSATAPASHDCGTQAGSGSC